MVPTPDGVVQATPDDWAVFARLRLASLLDSPDAFGSTHAREVDRDEDGWREWLARDDPKFLAFHDGHPVAVGGLYVTDERVARIIAMWTAAEHRGHGHARSILAALVAWAHERDLPVELDVNTANALARKVYEDFGFVATGELEPLREGSDQQIERMTVPQPQAANPGHVRQL